MNSIECILKRRSIRKYQDRLVEEEDIKILLESAMAAPSARNQQPWEFYVVSNKSVLDQIRGVGRNFDFNSPPLKIRRLIDYILKFSPKKIDLYDFS